MTHGSLPAGAAQSWLMSGHCARTVVAPRASKRATAPMVVRCRTSIIAARQQRACRECVHGTSTRPHFPWRECRDRAPLRPPPDVGAGLGPTFGQHSPEAPLLARGGGDVDLRCSAGYDPEDQLADLRIERA